MAIDPLKKSYRNGRKDQLEVDSSILRDADEVCDTREELVEYIRARLGIISEQLTVENVREIKDIHNLL